MGSATPLLDILFAHLPAAVSLAEIVSLSSQSRAAVETLLAFALGGDCPPRLPDARQEWTRTQSAALKALQEAIPSISAAKRPRDASQDGDDTSSKRQKTVSHVVDDADDPPRFTLPGISTTSPLRRKVDVTVHARSIRFVNPATRTLEASIPLTAIARAFMLPTRGKTKSHWTVVLLPSDLPDKSKTSPSSAQQVIFGLDALSPAPFDTKAYAPGNAPTPASTTITIAKGSETAPSIKRLLSHVPVPLLEPSTTVFRSACATPKARDGAAGIDAYLAAKAGTLWFFDAGILWGESKPCEFWAVSDLLPKDGVRLISATGRTCSVILSRMNVPSKGKGSDAKGEVGDSEDVAETEVIETVFSMVDGKEQDPITAWSRNRKHLFGKRTASSDQTATKGGGKQDKPPSRLPNGTIKGAAWDDSDSDDEDFEVASSEDLEHSSTDSDPSEGESEGEGRSGDESGSLSSDAEESGEASEEELQAAHHPLLRPGAIPRMSKAAIDMVVDLVQGGLADDATDEEDELEE